MGATYKYYLDGVILADEPKGWTSLVDKIDRVDEFGGVFVSLDVTLEFAMGDGYNLLYNKFQANFCDTTTIQIYELNCNQVDYDLIYDGILFVADCEFGSGFTGCYCSVKIMDNSFYAKIDNNKSIKIFVEVGKTKNGVAYTGATDYTITLFDPCTGLNIATRFPHTVRVYEAFRCLIAFMTDDTVDFYSSLFDMGGEAEGYCITDGIHLASTNPAEYSATLNIQKICFIDLFNEMNKKFKLGMLVDRSGVRPKLIIEKDSYFKNSTSILTMSDVNNIKATIDADQLFSQLHIGSSALDGLGCPGGLAFPKEQTFFTFNDESYFVLGVCNIDKTLDLFSQWQIDTNKIQDCVTGGSTNYDTDIFIIQTTPFDEFTGICVQGDPFNFGVSSPVRFYNPGLMNNEVVARYLGAVPNSIAQILADIIDQCFVFRSLVHVFDPVTTTTNILDPVVFTDKTTPPYNDAGGNFSLVNGTYTAPVGGIYSFELWFSFVITPGQYDVDNTKVRMIGYLDQYDAASNLLLTQAFGIDYAMLFGIKQVYLHGFNAFNMNATDYIKIRIGADTDGPNGYLIVDLLQATFKTTYTSNGGGDVHVYNPDEYPAYKYEFNYNLSRENWQKLLDQPNYAVTFNTFGGDNIKAFIQQATYERYTSRAKFTCIASKSIQP